MCPITPSIGDFGAAAAASTSQSIKNMPTALRTTNAQAPWLQKISSIFVKMVKTMVDLIW